ncbi:hypothetical protein M0R45_036652 [Rubus argutus]|uniref:Elongator complex protein 4 n=1 Tax=Rubus argutus TaxID=59490 RepID=A0AAW1VXN7_RUBAR
MSSFWVCKNVRWWFFSRNFMSEGLVHNQPIVFASPAKDPRGQDSFLIGTLPSPALPKDHRDPDQINFDSQNGKHEFCNNFDCRKPLERQFLKGKRIDCASIQNSPNLVALHDRYHNFQGLISYVPSYKFTFHVCDGNISCVGRIAIQSFCVPQCGYSNMEWDMLSILRSLKGMLRSSNDVAVHMADTLLSVKAIPDEDKELATLLTCYQGMVGLLNVQKVAQINTQVPVILEATTFSIKLQKRRYLVLECLNQAPIDGSSGSSYGTSGSCLGSSKTGPLDF